MLNLRQTLVAVVFLLSLPMALAAGPRTVVSLDQDWRFHSGASTEASATVFDDTAWSAISIPHMFPYTGEGDHKGTYRGEAWYRKTFTPPASWNGQRIFLRFDGVNLISETFLNGKRLGEHRGGFAAFTYEITGALKLGEANQLSVRVDNRMNQDVSPIEGSLLDGGIYRNVSLIVTGPVDITPMDYSSPGVFLTQVSVAPEKAVVQVRTEIDSNLASAQTVSVRLLLIDGAGKPMFKTTVSGPVAPGKINPVTQTITVPTPHLWNGVADPYLYSVRVDLLDDKGTVLDTVVQPLGLRSFHVDPKKGFVLNGVARQIHGVCLHQDFADMGWAIGPPQEQQDLKILREMGVDGLRLVHYQHSQSALDLYDRTGMLVWSELANFGRVSPNDGYRDSVKQQLIEMIRQNYNHPSIVIWSLFNELDSKTKAYGTPIVIELGKIAHKEDPTRPTSGAASGDTINNDHDMVASLDLISDNDYPGYYFGTPDAMGADIDKFNSLYGGRGIGMTEFGGGAKIGDHKQGLTTSSTNPSPPNSNFQPEEWQALIHEGNYAAMKVRPQVWGVFPWLAFDTGGIPRADGTIAGGNIKGLVTQDRKVRKDAYFFYQANWTTTPMLYLTSRRDIHRTDASTQVKVYSNADSVALKINGKDLGTEKPDGLHIFHWNKVTLESGENHVEVTTPDGLHDEATWVYKP